MGAAGSGRVSINQQVLDQVKAARDDITALTKILVGCTDEADKPGLVERVRLLEGAVRLVKGIAWVIGTILLGDIVMRLISWYQGSP